jgi:hypothetical protein
MLIVITIIPGFTLEGTEFRLDPGLCKIEGTVYFVLILREDVWADRFPCLYVATASPIGGVMEVAVAFVLRRLRVWA